ncbi:cilium assembly protein DZIP1L [Aplochiton taeniatus]
MTGLSFLSTTQEFLRSQAYSNCSTFPTRSVLMPGQFRSSTSDSASVRGSPSFPWSPGPAPPLRFRTRTEAMDWRRVAALDVERVAREMDVGVLQDFVSAVTFCDVSGERCPHCRNPADVALVKVLGMSQLSTEYLLHCQEYLSAQVAGLEERLRSALSQTDKEVEARGRLEAELQASRQESRRRKKVIATQQLLLQASSSNYHKCQFCEKSFVNYSYLQAHLQRRHPEITEAERQKKKQVQQMEEGIEEMRERLKLAQSRLETEREAEALLRQQELEKQRRKEVSARQSLESWKEEERMTFQEEMRGLKQLFLQEFKEVTNKSSSIEAKLHDLQAREGTVPNLGSVQQDDELRQRETELKWKMAQQKSEWKKRFKETQSIHLLEKEEMQSENERLKQALSADHSSGLQRMRQQISALSATVKLREQLIRSQEEKIKKLSARPVTVTKLIMKAIVESDVRTIQAATASKDEEEDEESDEEMELEDSGESLRRNPSLVKELRPVLEETLEEKLENMGLRKGTKGISQKTYKSLSSLVSGHWQQKSRQVQNLLELRKSLARELTQRLQHLQKNLSTSPPKGQKRSRQTNRSRRQSPKIKATPVRRSAGERGKAATAQPPKTPRALRKKNSTPPFSSEEDSVEDSAYVTSPGSRSVPSVKVLQSGPRPLGYPTNSPANQGDDWSDTEPSEGPSSPTAHNTQGSVVKSLTRSLERQLNTAGRKPVGGARVLPPAANITGKNHTVIKTLQLSDEESDLDLSSIQESVPLPAQGAYPVGRGSSDAGGTTGTSVWSSSNSRASRP